MYDTTKDGKKNRARACFLIHDVVGDDARVLVVGVVDELAGKKSKSKNVII